MRKLLLLLVLAVWTVSNAMAGTISGKIAAKETGEALPGANVYLQGTSVGAASDADGMFYIKVNDGNYTIICDYVGFATEKYDIKVSGDVQQNFELTEYLFAKTIDVVADRAKERETPVAFTNVEKQQMEVRLGSRDIPLVLDTTPSVYATMQGGGAGDARINVRGFNQSNVAIMINGVPVNDMENGWVYWSNWDGVGDATSSIQVQRGLSAVNLATPSIGGTMNILTDPTAQNAGIKYKQEFGNDGFLKSTLIANSGLIDGKYAVTGGVVRKTGDGLIDKTWTDAWAYYFGASYNINKNNRLELYGMGAPQRHGQNSYKQNIGVYSADFAKDLDDYDEAGLGKFFEVGREYNENWNKVSSSYKGKQYWNGSTHDRYDENFINERENYYHKPIVNLNWYTQLSKKLSLYSIAYYSGGAGGGSGTLGSLVWDNSNPSRIVDWDATIARNDTQTTGSRGILRNSVNEQWTIGAISKAYYKVNDNLKTSVGIDWRTAEIDHFREVRDLLGGDYFYDESNDFWTEEQRQRKLGDKVDYSFTNTVDWFGFYGQAEYSKDKLTTYGTYGWSTIKYTYVNHFLDDGNGKEVTAETDNINGFQLKGGASYRLTSAVDVYGNLGYVSKVPIFDAVIDDRDGTKASDPKNEKFTSVETGVNFHGFDGKLTLKGSFYYTMWADRSNTKYVQNEDGSEGLIFLTGMDQRHMGLELEAAYQPIPLIRFDAAASIANWEYTDDVTGKYKDYDAATVDQEETYYVKDLKVGDAPQTQFALAGSIFPVKGLMAQVVMKYNRDHYADWDPFSRTDELYPADGGDRGVESWKAPDYAVFDFHANYNIPLNWKGVQLQMYAHIFNLLDTEYIQDALDNSPYNAWGVYSSSEGRIIPNNPHQADAAEVFFGLPRTFNVGLTFTY